MTDEANTVTLTRPLKDAKGNDITALTFREPTVGDLIVAEKLPGKNAQIAAIVAKQNDLPLPIIETMLAGDFRRCDAVLGRLMGNDASAGGKTSQS